MNELPRHSTSLLSRSVVNENSSLSFPIRALLFNATQFQGVFLARRLHFLAQILNVIYCGYWILWGIVNGDIATAIGVVIFFPIFWFYAACFIRVLSELAISVLLVPSLLAKPAPAEASSANGGADADLAAYGVSGNAGTIV